MSVSVNIAGDCERNVELSAGFFEKLWEQIGIAHTTDGGLIGSVEPGIVAEFFADEAKVLKLRQMIADACNDPHESSNEYRRYAHQAAVIRDLAAEAVESKSMLEWG